MAPPSLSITALCDQLKALGRASLFYSTWWDPKTADLNLTYLGDTEGVVEVTGEEVMSTLTAPEQSGEIPLEIHVTNAAFTVPLPLFVADPDLFDVVSPTGSRHAGRERQIEATYYTVALIPERLLVQTGVRQTLAYVSAGNWTLDGVALTAAQNAILDGSFWFWKVVFGRPSVPFQFDDGGKAVGEATMHCVLDCDHPEGHQIWTRGDPYDSGIFIAPTVS